MPQQQIVPTWLAWNNANFTSPSGMSDPITGQPYNAGGLNLGDWFDATGEEAMNASYLANGLLFSGRYRLVQVDSAATAANVKTGTVGFMRAGSNIKSVVIGNAGTGQTAGTYLIAATLGSGGGSGAVIQVVVGSGGTITSVSVVQAGFGYSSAPAFSLTALGGSGGAVVAQLGAPVNTVTSADVALSGNAALAGIGPVRPVVFLNAITPGNYGFIQEEGVATVLAQNSSANQTANQFAIVQSTAANGTMAPSSATFGVYALGKVMDVLASPIALTPFKVLLDLPVVQD